MESLIRSAKDMGIEIIIVENISDNLLPFHILSQYENISYYCIDIECDDWSRGRTLNFGMKRAKGRYIVAWDVCFLCDRSFVKDLLLMFW